jgi:hypothetical protein
MQCVSYVATPIREHNTMMLQSGFFDIVERYRMLSELGDPLRMFKILVLQSLYNPGDDQPEFQIRDRFSLRATPFKTVLADSTYRSRSSDALLRRRAITNRIHYQSWHGAGLPAWQRAANQRRSRIRARVEYIFGHQMTLMKMTVICGIGLARAAIRIGLANLVYNMHRLAQLERCAA